MEIRQVGHGLGADGIKVFANENGNTVTDNVVTEAVGDPLAEVPYLMSAPQVTNNCIWARDLSNWGLVDVDADPATGIDGTNNATLLTDDSTSYEYTSLTIAKPSADYWYISFYLNKNGTAIFGLQINYPVSGLHVDPATGNWAYEPDYQGMFTDVDVHSHNSDWWKVTAQCNDVGTSWDFYLHPARQTVLGSTAISSATGTNTVDGFMVFDTGSMEQAIAMPPVFTSGTTVTQDADDFAFTEAVAIESGAYYCEVETTAGLAANQYLMDAFSWYQDDGNTYLSDGTTTTSVAGAGVMKVGVAFGDDLMRLTVDGASSPEVAFDGSLLAGAMAILDGDAVNGMRRLQGYSGTYEAAKVLIDELTS
jgi:hypothetical protein